MYVYAYFILSEDVQAFEDDQAFLRMFRLFWPLPMVLFSHFFHAEGQLKPPSDETIRYGRLLFGDTAEDYQGWKAGAEKSRAERDRLLSR